MLKKGVGFTQKYMIFFTCQNEIVVMLISELGYSVTTAGCCNGADLLDPRKQVS